LPESSSAQLEKGEAWKKGGAPKSPTQAKTLYGEEDLKGLKSNPRGRDVYQQLADENRGQRDMTYAP